MADTFIFSYALLLACQFFLGLMYIFSDFLISLFRRFIWLGKKSLDDKEVPL